MPKFKMNFDLVSLTTMKCTSSCSNSGRCRNLSPTTRIEKSQHSYLQVTKAILNKLITRKCAFLPMKCENVKYVHFENF